MLKFVRGGRFSIENRSDTKFDVFTNFIIDLVKLCHNQKILKNFRCLNFGFKVHVFEFFDIFKIISFVHSMQIIFFLQIFNVKVNINIKTFLSGLRGSNNER